MDIFFLIILLLILVLPTFLMSRRQRAKMAQINKLQDELQPGDRVVTTSGQHATVISTDVETVELEIAPGLVTTWEKMAVVRVISSVVNPDAPQDLTIDGAENEYPAADEPFDEDIRPLDENFDDEGRSNGHPENR